jgi:hypothetical protein
MGLYLHVPASLQAAAAGHNLHYHHLPQALQEQRAFPLQLLKLRQPPKFNFAYNS